MESAIPEEEAGVGNRIYKNMTAMEKGFLDEKQQQQILPSQKDPTVGDEKEIHAQMEANDQKRAKLDELYKCAWGG